MNAVSLSGMKQGERCVVRIINVAAELRQRLGDLGMYPGSQIMCAYIAPSGSPIAFWVKGTLIALRREDCLLIRGESCCG